MDNFMRPSNYSYHSNNSSMAGDDDDKKDVGGGSASKRQRVHFSCTECHRRKQKCNRETPCQHCIARKIPDRCKTFQPGEDPGDLGSRVTRLERSMQENFERVFELLQQEQQQLPPPPPPPQQDLSYQPQYQGQSNRQVYLQHPIPGTSAQQHISNDTTGSEAGDEVLERERSPMRHQFNPSKAISMKIDNLIDTFSGTQGTGTLTDPVRSIEGGTDLDILTQEYGMTDSITKSLLSILPTRDICDVLVDHFFIDINWLRQPLSQRLFRKYYDLLWSSGPTLTANNINSYAVIVIVMAIARCSINRPDMFPDDPRTVRLTARRLFYAGRKALLVSTMLGREDVQQVLGYSIASRFLVIDRRITEAWTCVANAVKTAHSIGLHRDGSKLHLSKEESETRRRIWSGIYFTDRNLCMNLGRPTQIDDNVVDTQMPSEEDDNDVFPDLCRPLTTTTTTTTTTMPDGIPPSALSYTKHRHRLAEIMGKIISTYQNLHVTAHYSDIISIDKELESFRKKLPGYFRSEINKSGELYHVDTAWDAGYPFVPIHRYLLESEIDHIRVSLHRPYLLRHNHRTGHRYEYSRRSCIAAAHHNIQLRREMIGALKVKYEGGKIPKVIHLHLGMYKTLNSLIIIGMYLIVTPQAEDAEMLLEHLRYYVDMWKKKSEAKDYVRDEMKDREASIVQIFLQRIEETRAESAIKSKKDSHKIKREAEGEVEDVRGATKRGKQMNRISQEEGHGNKKKTDEEDTAGVLLDLNPSAKNASTAAAPPYNNDYVSNFSGGGGRGGNTKASGDVMPPWPYLPMNTHHHATPSRPSSLSNGSITSPANTNPSPEDGASATSAQQLFESWFRYNAFDTMDFDTMNVSLDLGPNGLSNQMQPHLMTTTSFSGKGGGAAFAGNNAMVIDSPMESSEGPNEAHKATTTLQTKQPAMGSYSNVQLSTLPAPIWNSASEISQRKVGSELSDVVVNSSGDRRGGGGGGRNASTNGVAPSTNTLVPIATQGMGTNMATSGDQFSDASFDPIFWQTLIDKIST